MKISKKRLALCISLLFLSVLFLFLVKTVDVRPVGPLDSEVGFATLNRAVADFLPYRDGFYQITELLGYVAILSCAVLAAMGLYQWIKRKKLFQVDVEILIAGGLYLVIFLLYVFFEIVPVNFRPVILDAEKGLESSFPSSHTLLSVVMFGSIARLASYLFANRRTPVLAVKIWAYIMMALTVVGRLLSGAHWCSDIIGSVVISTTLLALFDTALVFAQNLKKQKQA